MLKQNYSESCLKHCIKNIDETMVRFGQAPFKHTDKHEREYVYPCGICDVVLSDTREWYKQLGFLPRSKSSIQNMLSSSSMYWNGSLELQLFPLF